MLEYLHLKNVGPAPEMRLDLGPRLNLITGDNGLGKSFLLDIAWWALTRRWPAEVNPKLVSGLMARPRGAGQASIGFAFTSKVKVEEYSSTFNREWQAWTGRAGRPANPGLVLYAQVDGSFALWDPARNYWRTKGDADVQERPPAYVFSAREVWDGLQVEGNVLCNGLIVDWARWQSKGGKVFRQLKAALKSLSPADGEQLLPGKSFARLGLDDVRDIPTLRMPYGEDVPVLHASAGMRRIIALAYFLVWSWNEHVRASAALGQQTARQVIFLVDEIEAHLHPRWQRQIVKSLLSVVQALAADADVQILSTTHSPLVLASVEPLFDEAQDAWFDLDLVPGTRGRRQAVSLEKRPFVRRGDVSRWLTSEAFDLGSATSVEAEKLLAQAAIALSDERFDQAKARKLDQRLRRVLGDTDPFWMRWRYVGEKRGWLP